MVSQEVACWVSQSHVGGPREPSLVLKKAAPAKHPFTKEWQPMSGAGEEWSLVVHQLGPSICRIYPEQLG